MSVRHWSEDRDVLRQVATWLVEAGLAEIEIGDRDGGRLRIVADAHGEARDADHAAPPAPRHAADGEEPAIPVTAPAFGHLRLATAADGMAHPAVGAAVLQGETIAVLEVGTVAVPVVAPCDGIVMRWLAVPDALIGYGAPLVLLAPASAAQA